MVSAEFAMIFWPVAQEPVKTILPIPSWAVIAAPSLSLPAMQLTTPFGNTSFMSSIRRSVERGVKGDGLLTTVLPERTAGTMCQIAIRTGKFQGVIEPTTPIGLR